MKDLNAIKLFVKEDVIECINNSHQLPDGLRDKHLYITGITGYLGSWLLEFISFLNDEHSFKIRVSGACHSLHDFSVTRKHLLARKEFSITENDIRNLSELPKDTTHIIHAAAFTNRHQFSSYPSHVAENNINSTIRVFRLAQQLGELQNILLLSSGLVYGRHEIDSKNLTEDSFGTLVSAFDANQIYTESKRASEAIASAFLSESKLPVSVARPFAFVGPYQNLHLPWAVTDFIRDSFQGGPIKILGDGSTIRSIMYASDFANWILHIAEKAKPRSVYNVGSSQPIDLLSLATMIGSHFNPVPKIHTSVGNFSKPNDKLVPSTAKAERELNLTLTVNLNKSIERSINWHKLLSS